MRRHHAIGRRPRKDQGLRELVQTHGSARCPDKAVPERLDGRAVYCLRHLGDNLIVGDSSSSLNISLVPNRPRSASPSTSTTIDISSELTFCDSHSRRAFRAALCADSAGPDHCRRPEVTLKIAIGSSKQIRRGGGQPARFAHRGARCGAKTALGQVPCCRSPRGIASHVRALNKDSRAPTITYNSLEVVVSGLA